MNYWHKMKGGGQSPPKVGLSEVVWSWVGSFLGIAAVSLIHFKLLDQTSLMMIIGSFGASAVLIYGAIRSPLAQPRNLLGGHILSAFIGVTAFQWLGGEPWLGCLGGRFHLDCFDASHQDPPSTGRGYRPDCSDWRRNRS